MCCQFAVCSSHSLGRSLLMMQLVGRIINI
nr:MAG TPA: hypothetical protein [Caudoviricetes sp.]